MALSRPWLLTRSYGNQRHSEALRGTQRHSEALSGTQRHSEALSGTQRQSAALGCLPAVTAVVPPTHEPKALPAACACDPILPHGRSVVSGGCMRLRFAPKRA